MKTQTQPKHSPGPWMIARDRSIRQEPPSGQTAGFFICDIAENPNIEADARLIAAAPELLEGIQKALDKAEFRRCPEVAKELNTLIAKATHG